MNLRKISFYIDTNIMNYAYDFRSDYWEHTDELPNIMEKAKHDKSNQINEYMALQLFQVLTYWNEFIFIIGDRMLDELNDIKDGKRRNLLVNHAERIRQLHTPWLYIDDVKKFKNDYMEEIDKLSILVGPKDSLLLCEAIVRNCNFFLTTDSKITSLGDISGIKEIEITSPLRFINYAANTMPAALDLRSYNIAPDISRLSILIPDEDDK